MPDMLFRFRHGLSTWTWVAKCNEASLQLLQATIGIDFLSKTMYLEDRTVRLQLW